MGRRWPEQRREVEWVSPFAAPMGELARPTGISEAARSCVGAPKVAAGKQASTGCREGERSRRADSGFFLMVTGAFGGFEQKRNRTCLVLVQDSSGTVLKPTKADVRVDARRLGDNPGER